MRTSLALIAALLPLAAGCSHWHSLPDGPDVERYTLVAVNGGDLPTTVQHGRLPVRVYSGEFRMGPNGQCGSRQAFGEPNGEDRLERDSVCTYVRDGNAFTMKWKDAGGTTATLDGDVFTMDNHGMVFRYVRK